MTERGERLIRALGDHRRPCALIDLAAFDANLARLTRPTLAAGLTVRIASKSVRVPALLRRALAADGVRGLLTYSAAETRWLAENGFDDLFLAYPPAPGDVPDLVAASKLADLWITVDHRDQVDALAGSGTPLKLAIDVDLSLRIGPAHLGVRRSPIRSVDDALSLAAHIERATDVQLDAVLAYEAQIAGVPDATGSLLGLPIRLIKRRSRALALQRRAAIVDALRERGPITVVNGGGTGSVDFTATDRSVTEVAAGSGLYCPHLFDDYRGLDIAPAAFFALDVVRHSDPGFSTVFGGGYVASGQAGPDRLPKVFWPSVEPVELEGFGEVQTPLKGELRYGSVVLCRHAKAGELMEHFDVVHLIEGDRIIDTVPTYRVARIARRGP